VRTDLHHHHIAALWICFSFINNPIYLKHLFTKFSGQKNIVGFKNKYERSLVLPILPMAQNLRKYRKVAFIMQLGMTLTPQNAPVLPVFQVVFLIRD